MGERSGEASAGRLGASQQARPAPGVTRTRPHGGRKAPPAFMNALASSEIAAAVAAHMDRLKDAAAVIVSAKFVAAGVSASQRTWEMPCAPSDHQS